MQGFLLKTTWKFLLDHYVTSLPIDPLNLIFLNGWKVYTYESFSNIVHKSVANLISEYENDGFAFWSRRDRNFVICYNDLLPISLCRWTLLHEIAHIYLRHISPHTPLLSYVHLDKLPLFEIEAQGFAQHVLCPSIVLHDCRAIEPESIMRLCGISAEDARCCSAYMKKLEAHGIFRSDPLEREVEKQFSPFIRQYRFHQMRERRQSLSCEFATEFCRMSPL